MYTITVIVRDDQNIDISLMRRAGTHPIGGSTIYDILYSDIYEFGLAMGLPARDIPARYRRNSRTIYGTLTPTPIEDRYGDMVDPLYNLVRNNLGLFVQFLAWRVSKRSFSTANPNVANVAASTSTFAVGMDTQNVDWLSDVTTERALTLELPSKNDIKQMILRLPEGMVGNVCTSYIPSKLVAQSYLSGVTSVRKLINSLVGRYREDAAYARASSFGDAVGTLSTILRQPGWDIQGSELVYTNRIEVERVMYKGKLFDLPPEYKGRLYINEIRMPAAPTIGNVTGRGLHPHVSGSDPTVLLNLCAGTLSGAPISEVVNLPEALRTAYYGSMYGGKATRMIEYLFSMGFKNEFAEEFPGLSECLINAYHDGVSNGEVFGR